MEPLQHQTQAALLANATPEDADRLQSLMTPHGTSWAADAPLLSTMPPSTYRAAARWATGIPFRKQSYLCPTCGRVADPKGQHAVTCQRSGAIGRGHTVLRDTLAEILTRAGLQVQMEQSPPGRPDVRPADILVGSWKGRPLAIDVTVVTSIRRSPGAALTVDTAASNKLKRSKELCEYSGWAFLPFVADTFGALRCDARDFIRQVIARRSARFAPMTPADAGRSIWSAISAAAISRAGTELARLANLDSPLNMPIAALSSPGPLQHPGPQEVPPAAVPSLQAPVPAVVAPGSPHIQVQLWAREDLSFTLALRAEAATDSLFDAVIARGLDSSDFWLSYGGHSLLRGTSISHYGVTSGATILINTRGRGGTCKAAAAFQRNPRPSEMARTTCLGGGGGGRGRRHLRTQGQSPTPPEPATPGRPPSQVQHSPGLESPGGGEGRRRQRPPRPGTGAREAPPAGESPHETASTDSHTLPQPSSRQGQSPTAPEPATPGQPPSEVQHSPGPESPGGGEGRRRQRPPRPGTGAR